MKENAQSALLVITLILFTLVLTAQELPRDAVSGELGKTGLILNLTYDHRFGESGFGARALAGKSFGRHIQAVTAGAGLYKLFGHRSVLLETGWEYQFLDVDLVSDDENPGLGLIYPNHSVTTWCPAINIGMRKYGQHTLFRAGLSAVLIERKVVPGAYLSLGRIF